MRKTEKGQTGSGGREPERWNWQLRLGQLTKTWERWTQKIHPADRGVVVRVVKRAVLKKMGFGVDYRVKDSQSEWRWMYAKGEVKNQKLQAVVVDVSEKKVRENDLKVNEKKFRSVFETVLEAMVIVNDELKIVDVNPAAANFVGKSKSWLRNKPLTSLLDEDNRVTFMKSWHKFLQGGVQKGQLELRENDGKLRIVEYNIVPHGQTNSNLVVWRDITETVMEEKRREHFLTIAGHELRSPLTGAKIFVQTLRQYVDLREGKKGEYLKKTEEKLNLLAELINDLLDVTGFREGKLAFVTEEFYFDKLVDKVVDEFRDTNKTYHIEREGQANVKINGDQKRIVQVITNLLRNAVKYSPQDKKVVVKSWETEYGVGLSVEDYGIGMSKEDTKRVFDLYYRSSLANRDGIKGLGVGLYICAEIVKHHGGKLWVKSREGEGSVFSFELPRSPIKPMKLERKLMLQSRRV